MVPFVLHSPTNSSSSCCESQTRLQGDLWGSGDVFSPPCLLLLPCVCLAQGPPWCVAAPEALQTPLVSLCVCPVSPVSVPPAPGALGDRGVLWNCWSSPSET